MVKIIKMLAPKGSKCRPGYALKPEYVTIHNAGNHSKGADADNHGAYLQNSGQYNTVSWHYAVDEKQAVLCIPENENAWHAGDGGNGTGNRKSLAIEICDNSDGDIRKATDNAVELTAYLMKKYNYTYDRALELLRSKRSVVNPNKGFERQLRQFEQINFSI